MPNPPHVVMLVANDLVTDTRVKKEAIAAADAGLRVTVLAFTSPRAPEDTVLGSVYVKRVTVDFSRRDARLAARAERRKWRPGPIARRPKSRNPKVIRVNQWFKDGWDHFDGLVGRIPFFAHWSRDLPEVYDYERAMNDALDELQPDLIHAHDMHVVRIADHAVARAKAAGRKVPWVYDSHEYVPGLSRYGGRTRRVIKAWSTLERSHIRHADHVVTVSPAISAALRKRYHLRYEPAVVLNTPAITPRAPGEVRASLRAVCGLADDVPLVTYSGGVTQARGVHTAIEAMALLPGVHLAVVCVPSPKARFIKDLRELAAEKEVTDRVHFVDPVEPGHVVDYLASADIGLIPGLPFRSHQMSLPNKVFEYLHAGLPVVASELDTLGPFVRQHGIGTAFTAENPTELAAAIRRILDDHATYAAHAADPALREEFSWARQEDVLVGVYEKLLGVSLRHPDIADEDRFVDLSERPVDTDRVS